VVFLSLLGTAALLARMGAHLQTDWLWFHELGQDRAFWTMLFGRWLASSFAALATTFALLANFWIVERTAPPSTRLPRDQARIRNVMVAVYLGVSACAGLLIGRSMLKAHWQEVVLWMHRKPFGVVDPLLHRDVGFYVFSLPLYQLIAQWLLITSAIALLSAVLGHVASGAIRLKPPPVSATRGAHAHLLGLGAVLLVVLAWRHWLAQFELTLPHGGKIPGAGYTDIHVQLPWLRVLTVVAMAAAGLFVYGAVKRSRTVPGIAVVVVLVAELVNPSILPSSVQRFIVDPQTLSREHPYIERSLKYTRLAYDLEGVSERHVSADGVITGADLRANRDVLRNIQLWDTDVLRPQIDQQQSIGSYYAFPNVTVDRYRKDGKTRGMLVAERALDLTRLSPSARTWANDHLAYTHGYGIVAVPAGGVDREGRPRFVTSEFSAGRAPTLVREPRLYFGVQPRAAKPWVVVDTRRTEIEKPIAGDVAEPSHHYDGPGGIPLSNVLRRSVFALRYGDLNLLLSHTLTSKARIVLHRDVRDRLRTLAPFLRWEDHPEVAVIDGRVEFLAHGYTTSSTYPYAAPVMLGGRRINYIRASVLATVDAHSGRVTMYVTDPDDAIIQAWRSAFPGLFTAVERMPASVRAHLRYPRELFDVQSEVWSNYHQTDVEDFYTQSDSWEQPVELSGPVHEVGSVRFRFKRGSPSMDPSFVLARLPGERRMRFMLTQMFTPHSQENLSGYLAGEMDADGRARLTQLTLPRSRMVLGPSQISRQILATPAVGDELRLLNEETSDLGDRSIDTVELSDPRIVPIGDSFLYVQPIYVTAQGNGVTRVRLVTVYLNGRVGWGRSLDAALARARRAARS